MKNKTLYGLFLILAVFVSSCELPDNIDPKNAKTVSPNALFTQAEYALFQQVAELDYNLNCSRFLAQYLSEVTYTNETRYNFSDRQVPDNFSGILYRAKNILAGAKYPDKEIYIITDGQGSMFGAIELRLGYRAVGHLLRGIELA